MHDILTSVYDFNNNDNNKDNNNENNCMENKQFPPPSITPDVMKRIQIRKKEYCQKNNSKEKINL